MVTYKSNVSKLKLERVKTASCFKLLKQVSSLYVTVTKSFVFYTFRHIFMFTTHMLQNLFIACYVWVLLPPPAHWAVAVSSANGNCWNLKLIFIWCSCRGGNQDILLQEPFNWSSAEEIQNITTKPTFKRVLTITAGCIFVLFNWISSLTVHVKV